MREMTIAEVLRDPMIRLVLRADGTSLSNFADLLKTAARDRDAALRLPPKPHFLPSAAAPAH